MWNMSSCRVRRRGSGPVGRCQEIVDLHGRSDPGLPPTKNGPVAGARGRCCRAPQMTSEMSEMKVSEVSEVKVSEVSEVSGVKQVPDDWDKAYGDEGDEVPRNYLHDLPQELQDLILGAEPLMGPGGSWVDDKAPDVRLADYSRAICGTSTTARTGATAVRTAPLTWWSRGPPSRAAGCASRSPRTGPRCRSRTNAGSVPSVITCRTTTAGRPTASCTPRASWSGRGSLSTQAVERRPRGRRRLLGR